jgi:hypothetical protein
MHRFLASALILVLLSVAAAQAQDTAAPSYPVMAPIKQYLAASRETEVALARTAAPPSISADAEVLVLGRSGYETAVKGKNGFVCFVERSWTAGFDDPVFWNPRLRAPNCFNAPAVRTVLPQYLKRTEWLLAGATREQLIEKARAAFESHEFVAPEPGSLTFMLSKQGTVGPDGGHWLPHLMFFVTRGQAAVWGAGWEASPIIGKDGSPAEPTVLLVPVLHWSDGTPAVPPAAPHKM